MAVVSRITLSDTGVRPTPGFLEWWIPLEGLLLQTLTRKGVSSDTAQDIIQEIAVVIIRQVQSLGSYDAFLSRFQSFASFVAWARIRASWMLIDRIRAEKHVQMREDAGLQASMEADQEGAVYFQELLALINNLPERQRLALTGMIEGSSASEIADHMGIAEASVRSLQRFGKSRLATVLLEHASKGMKEEK